MNYIGNLADISSSPYKVEERTESILTSLFEIIQEYNITDEEHKLISLLKYDDKTVRWLYLWLDKGKTDDNLFMFLFIIKNLKSEFFFPFHTIDEIKSKIIEDNTKPYFRISSTVPGNISVSYFDKSSLSIRHHRYKIIKMDDEILLQGNNQSYGDIDVLAEKIKSII